MTRPARPARLGAGEPAGNGRADVLLRGGRVYRDPADGTPTFADAIALRDGAVLAVGTEADVRRLAPRAHVEIDLEGRTVVPGLIDSHLHLVRGGVTWTQETHWFEVASLEEGLRLLDDRARAQPPGTWLRVVGGWHPGQFAEGRGPTADELTRRFPDHPVYVQLLYEEAVLNGAGLARCGITGEAPDPPLGTFDRDATGAVTGTVRGVGAFGHCLAQMPVLSPAEQADGIAGLMALLNRHGVTGAIDTGGLGLAPEGYAPLFELWREQRVTVRTRLYLGAHSRGAEEEDLAGWLRHIQPGFGDPWLRSAGLGEITVFGCHDLEGLAPFAVDDNSRHRLEAVLRDAAVRGWPVHLHAVLDTTADAILGVMERVAVDVPIRDLRWSLAHLEPVSMRNLDRIAALGLGVAVQDRLVYRATDSARVWGADAVRGGPPVRAILDRGIPLGAGTDSTRVTSPNPWVSLWWLVTGRTVDTGPERTPEQCLTRAEALDAYTIGSAWFSGEEQQRGRLAVGMAADLAVLSDDYFTVEDDAVRRLSSVLTLVDGRPVHAGGPFAGLS